MSDTHQPTIDLSIVMPCLNESDTIGACITKAKSALATLDVAAEIVIADNGSADGSCEIARGLGARGVAVARPHNYWRKCEWQAAFGDLGWTVAAWNERLGLYGRALRPVFEYGLHFVAALEPCPPSA